MLHRRFLSTVIFLALSSNSVSADDQDLFDLDLDQLMQIKVSTGQLFDVAKGQSPAAITIVSQDQIALTPAKNLAELLEIYVPGLMLMAHSEGDKIGIRGNIAAENYKLLILLNGKDITNMIYEGVLTEIDQWDLNDIAKVEVVRGPGSVVYGSGAIAGIINIITKHPENEATEWSFAHNHDYESTGVSFQTSRQFDNSSLYLFGSYRTTDGLDNPDYYLPRGDTTNATRYLGKGPTDPLGPQPYLADTFDRPQIKAHIDYKHDNGFRIFSRFTQSGQVQHFRNQVPQLDTNGNVVGITDNRKVSLRSFMFAPEYTFKLNEKESFKTAITYDSQEYLRYDQVNLTWPEDHPNNVKDYAFSQNRWVASFIYQQVDKLWNVSAGYEYRGINMGAPWGENADHIMVREGIYMISSQANSVYTQDLSLRNRPQPGSIIEIGNGLDFQTHSQLLEFNYLLSEDLTLHYGHRLDFPDVASNLYAPRLALIKDLGDNSTLTVTAQRAQRLLPLRAQYLLDTYEGEDEHDHETIDSLEFSYQAKLNAQTSLNSRVFYSDLEAVGFTGLDLELLGHLELLGLELELVYKTDNYEIIANHSYIDNLDFTLSDVFRNSARRNNISYSDYRTFTRGDVPIPLSSTGDGINNWSANTTKIIYTHRFMDTKLLLQLNTQIYWDYDGSYDEMRMYQNAYANFNTSTLENDELASFTEQQLIFENEKRLLEAEDAYDMQINIGASITYRHSLAHDELLEYSFRVQNLFADRKKYYVNTGSSNFFTNRLSFLKEPTIIGLNVRYSY